MSIFFLLVFSLPAQVKTGRAEICWALFHPFAALKVKSITNKCALVVKDRAALVARLDNLDSGGKLDAFRHCFHMAAYAQKIKPRKVRKLGIAHEKTNYRQFKKGWQEYGERPDSLATVMDLHNNDLGLSIGLQHPDLPLDSLKNLVVKEIDAGKARILKRNKALEYVDCEGNPIPRGHYAGAWFLPKCLIPSNEN